MTRRIDQLTPAQRDRMGSFAQEWIQHGLRTEPLTEEEWDAWTAGARRCYEYAGIPFPRTVVRVSSPIVGAFAAPIADLLIRRSVDGAVGGAVRGAVGGAVDDAVRNAVDGAVGDAVRGAVGGAVRGAVGGAVRGAVGGAVRGAVDGAVGGAVGGAVRGAVRGAVGGAVRDAVGGAVGDAVDGAVGDAVDDAVDDAVHGAVRDAVHGAVRDAVHGAVHGAVDGAVSDAVRGAVLSGYYKVFGGRIGGGWTWNGWSAYAAFFRDIAGLEFDTDIWDRASALEAADSAGWWWPFRDFVMVCDTPTVIHRERVGPDGWGSHRLHCASGPAIAWADGWGVYAWHGVRVPAWVIEEPTLERALAEGNSEIRRCAFESLGWDEAIRGLGLKPIATAADPANDPHELALYRLPADVYDQPVNLLLMTNGSPDRSGALRRYGETVPARITDPIAAAAWQYDVSPDVYRQLARRT